MIPLGELLASILQATSGYKNHDLDKMLREVEIELRMLMRENDGLKGENVALKAEVQRLKGMWGIEETDVEYHENAYITLKSRPGYFCSNCWSHNQEIRQLGSTNIPNIHKCQKCGALLTIRK